MYGNSATFGSNVSLKMSTDRLCSLNLPSRQIGETKIQPINLIKYGICLKFKGQSHELRMCDFVPLGALTQ